MDVTCGLPNSFQDDEPLPSLYTDFSVDTSCFTYIATAVTSFSTFHIIAKVNTNKLTKLSSFFRIRQNWFLPGCPQHCSICLTSHNNSIFCIPPYFHYSTILYFCCRINGDTRWKRPVDVVALIRLSSYLLIDSYSLLALLKPALRTINNTDLTHCALIHTLVQSNYHSLALYFSRAITLPSVALHCNSFKRFYRHVRSYERRYLRHFEQIAMSNPWYVDSEDILRSYGLLVEPLQTLCITAITNYDFVSL